MGILLKIIWKLTIGSKSGEDGTSDTEYDLHAGPEKLEANEELRMHLLGLNSYFSQQGS